MPVLSLRSPLLVKMVKTLSKTSTCKWCNRWWCPQVTATLEATLVCRISPTRWCSLWVRWVETRLLHKFNRWWQPWVEAECPLSSQCMLPLQLSCLIRLKAMKRLHLSAEWSCQVTSCKISSSSPHPCHHLEWLLIWWLKCKMVLKVELKMVVSSFHPSWACKAVRIKIRIHNNSLQFNKWWVISSHKWDNRRCLLNTSSLTTTFSSSKTSLSLNYPPWDRWASLTTTRDSDVRKVTFSKRIQ